nr:hypothetical protein [Bdellovibrionales bacterium]
QRVTFKRQCEAFFKNWPKQDYSADIHSIFAEWKRFPETTSLFLRTCNTIHLTKYVKPENVVRARRDLSFAHLSNLLGNFELLEAGAFLREEIRLYAKIFTTPDPKLPPSPYSILTGYASTESELDLAITMQTDKAYGQIVGAMSGLAIGLRGSVWFLKLGKFGSKTLGFTLPGLAATVLAWGSGEIVETGAWYVTERDLISHLHRVTEKLVAHAPDTPPDFLLDEYFSAVKRLGYFYSYELFLAEDGDSGAMATANSSCAQQIDTYFRSCQSPELELALARQFAKHQSCKDAATQWIGAGLFLKKVFPKSEIALEVADRLIGKAQYAHMGYQATRMAKANPPICQAIDMSLGLGTGMGMMMECRDRISGEVSRSYSL